MKITPRLDYERLADALADRGLVDREALRLVLDQAIATGGVFPEILVREDLVTDWEISRVASEIFNLPFLPIDVAKPNKALLKELDPAYLRDHGIVPIERFDDVLTVCMPALVPTSVLNGVTNQEGLVVLPLVGLVSSNRNWLDEHAPALEAQAAPLPAGGDDGWADLFDEGDKAVNENLVEGQERRPQVPGESNRKIVLDDIDFG